MNEELQDQYALIVNEVGKRMDAAKDDVEQESVALDAIIRVLGNFNLRLSKVEDSLRG